METLEEILDRLKIERFAENIDYEDLPLESVASMTQLQLQKNFRIDKETAKKLFKELETLRRKKLIQGSIETPKKKTSSFSLFNPQFYTPKNMTNFVSSFTKLTNLSYKPGDEWPMDIVGAAMSASSRAFYNMCVREGSIEQYGDPNQLQNNSGWTALMFATAMGRDNVVQLMLERNVCNFLAKNAKGETAMMIAASFGHVRVIELLFDGFRNTLHLHPDQNANHSPMDILIQQDNQGFTPLHYAAYYAQTDALQLLLQLGAPPNVPDSSGMTPTLHACSDEAQEPCLKMLLEVGGNLDLRNAEGKNGLEISGNRDSVKRMYFEICKRQPSAQFSSTSRHQHLYGSF